MKNTFATLKDLKKYEDEASFSISTSALIEDAISEGLLSVLGDKIEDALIADYVKRYDDDESILTDDKLIYEDNTYNYDNTLSNDIDFKTFKLHDGFYHVLRLHTTGDIRAHYLDPIILKSDEDKLIFALNDCDASIESHFIQFNGFRVVLSVEAFGGDRILDIYEEEKTTPTVYDYTDFLTLDDLKAFLKREGYEVEGGEVQ